MAKEKLTFEERVWFWMRRQDRAVSSQEVTKRFQCKRHRAANALWRLVRKKSAVKVGSGRGCKYLATSLRPYPQVGISVKTYEALRKHSFPPFTDHWRHDPNNPNAVPRTQPKPDKTRKDESSLALLSQLWKPVAGDQHGYM